MLFEYRLGHNFPYEHTVNRKNHYNMFENFQTSSSIKEKSLIVKNIEFESNR